MRIRDACKAIYSKTVAIIACSSQNRIPNKRSLYRLPLVGQFKRSFNLSLESNLSTNRYTYSPVNNDQDEGWSYRCIRRCLVAIGRCPTSW